MQEYFEIARQHMDALIMLIAFIVAIVATGTICQRRGRMAERQLFFQQSQVLILNTKDAIKLGGGVVQSINGTFYVTPKDEHLRRAGSIDDAVRWAKNLNPDYDISLHMMPEEKCDGQPIVVFFLQRSATPAIINGPLVTRGQDEPSETG